MDLETIKETLRGLLVKNDLKVISDERKLIKLEKEYSIEIENASLFKLVHEGFVVAPFNDLNEMCNFIKMDMALNEEN